MVQAQADTDPAVAPQTDPVLHVAEPTGAVPGEGEGQAGATVEGAVAEAPKPISLAEIADDDLLAQLRERKNSDGLSLEDRLRKSERDRFASEYRKEQGKRENVQRRTARWMEQYGIDPSSVDPQQNGEIAALYDLAQNDSLGNLGEAWVRATANEFGVTDQTLLEDALSHYRENPTGIDELASKTWVAARDAIRARTLAEASLSEVPEGSKLRGDLIAEAARLADVELKARDKAANRPDSLPTAPSGGPPATDDARFRGLDLTAVAALPDTEYKAWQAWRAKLKE